MGVVTLPDTLMDTDALRVETSGDVVVKVDVVPNATVTQVARCYASLPRASIRLRLQATPVDGKANAAVRKWLAGCLGVPPSKVALMRGSTSQHKQLESHPPSRCRLGGTAGQRRDLAICAAGVTLGDQADTATSVAIQAANSWASSR